MSYSDIYLRQSSKPSPVLVVFAVLAVVGFTAAFFRPTSTTRAAKQSLLERKLVNVMAHEAGLFYKTDSPVVSWVAYGTQPDKLDHIAYDERDVGDNHNSTILHYVSFKDLQENTKYYYKILTDTAVLTQNGDQTSQFTTTLNYTVDPNVGPAYGTVRLANGEHAQDAFVFYQYPNAYPLLNLTKGGDFVFPLNYLIDAQTGKLVPLDINQTVTISIFSEDGKSTTFQTQASNTKPLPKPVILGEQYLGMGNVVAVTPEANSKVIPYDALNTIDILYPKEGVAVPGKHPLIKGTALPSKEVSLTINSTPVHTFKVTADSTGQWMLTLPILILPGPYQLTMKTVDAANKPQTIVRNFEMAKSGETVLGTATGSGGLTPTVAPTDIPASTVAPTDIPVATTAPADTVIPTSYLAQATTAPTGVTTPPVTGANTNLLIVSSFAFVILGVGLLLIF